MHHDTIITNDRITISAVDVQLQPAEKGQHIHSKAEVITTTDRLLRATLVLLGVSETNTH